MCFTSSVITLNAKALTIINRAPCGITRRVYTAGEPPVICKPRMSLAGHLWTIVPVLRHRLRPQQAPAAVPWSTTVHDAQLGSIALRGRLRERADSDTCVIVVHGLGGTTETHYCVQAARAVDAAGFSCLRLALRGADRDGEDFYHAGMVADIAGAAGSEALRRYSRLLVIGYSLGGHVALRYALAPSDPRVRAIAAICSPLDLELGARHIDGPAAFIYRRHVLAGLNAIYAEVARRRSVPTPLARVLRARTIREWDSLTVVPRHGFDSVEHYYGTISVGPSLGRLALPVLLLQNRDDPMVPPRTYEPHLASLGAGVTLRWLSGGGHVGYPGALSLGERGARGVEAQALSWLARQ
jgi:predicted alpha/beta-fold hydrolase